jgi:enoyl-CoA hydratase
VTETCLLIAHEGAVARLTLNRPGKLNALSRDLRRALIAALSALAEDDRVRAVVLTGAGRAFCAGLDLAEIGQSGMSVEGNVGDENVVDAITAFPKPIIGAINGPAITGGFEIALALDILLVSGDATFIDSHVKLGIAPGWGLSQRLARAIGRSRANEISLTGRPLSAAEAVAWGLANSVFPGEALVPAAMLIAGQIAQHSPAAVVEMKRLIAAGWHSSLDEGLALEDREARAANTTVDGQRVGILFGEVRGQSRGG